MKAKPEKFYQYWSKTKMQGPVAYSVKIGIIYALGLAFLTPLIDLQEKSIQELYFTQKFAISVFVKILFGMLFVGPLLWWMNNNRYKKLEAETKFKQAEN